MPDAFTSRALPHPAPADPGDHRSRRESQRDVEPLSLVHVLSVLLRYRLLIVTMAALTMVAVVAFGLTEKRTWSSTASFVPQSRRGSNSNLAGIAAQFGVAVPTGDAAQSPAFYADLVRSRQILEAIVDTVYRTGPGARDTVSLSRLFEVTERNPQLRRAETLRRLSERVAATPVTKTGVVTLSVRTTSPLVSQQVASHLISELNRFNLQTRQSQAAAERRFTERRLAEARDSLRQAELRLQGFLQGNRMISGSPQLQFTNERLRRDVLQRQEVYGTLAQAYEQARIEEVRDTPVLTLIESPNVPMRPDARGLLTRGLLAGLIGAMLGILVAFVRDTTANARAEGDAAYLELARLRREALADVRHPFRAIRRVLSRAPSRATTGGAR